MTKPIDALVKASELPLGFTAPAGSTVEFKTGDWRSVRPVLDRSKCVYCGFCYYYCPDGAYQDMGTEEKYYKVNLDFCKGCGVCAHECPKKALEMTLEEV
ncbi:MAG: 4Fe-4S binding protein [Deltaproteobacteria bacterium]|jgi:pyruvate ferredoxin oxidoreductase delta subunit|nr:4Fe-4S binding protein [Deltaproteobacteria bacterium]